MPQSPTHIAYTPVWEPDGRQCEAWLAIGDGWRDADGGISGMIHSLPINPDTNFTGHFLFVAIGAPEPQPLTVTRDEFLESLYDLANSRARKDAGQGRDRQIIGHYPCA